MNEAAGFRPSRLTKQQKLAQQASVYGLDPEIWAPTGKKQFDMTPAAGFTAEQLEQMRQILAQHDSSGKGGNKEFDLAKPPTPPYRHQEYPKAMYHADGRTRNAGSAEEQEAAEASGWSTKPNVTAPAAFDPWEGLSAEDKAEAQALDAKLAEEPETPRRSPGRPRKVQDAA